MKYRTDQHDFVKKKNKIKFRVSSKDCPIILLAADDGQRIVRVYVPLASDYSPPTFLSRVPYSSSHLFFERSLSLYIIFQETAFDKTYFFSLFFMLYIFIQGIYIYLYIHTHHFYIGTELLFIEKRNDRCKRDGILHHWESNEVITAYICIYIFMYVCIYAHLSSNREINDRFVFTLACVRTCTARLAAPSLINPFSSSHHQRHSSSFLPPLPRGVSSMFNHVLQSRVQKKKQEKNMNARI